MRSGGSRGERWAVIGAGPTGLHLALRLTARGEQVVLFERAADPGGLASSFALDGVRIERFYHFICRHDQRLLGLIRELGLASRLRWRPTEMDYFILGRRWPFSTARDLLGFRPLHLLERLRFGVSMLLLQGRREWRSLDRHRAADWLRRTSGSAAYEMIWAPLLEKKFGGHAGEISAAWIWGRTRRRALSRMGFPPREHLGYLEGGSEALLQAMITRIREQGGELLTGAPVRRIRQVSAGVEVTTDRQGRELFDRVISTIPLPALLEIAPDLPGPYRRRLAGQEYLHVICAVLLLDAPLGPKYWINIYDRDIPFVGVIEYTHLNPLPSLGGRSVIYLPAYVAEEDPLWSMDDEAVGRLLLERLELIHPHLAERRIDVLRVFRERHAQPICRWGHLDRLIGFRTPWPRLLITDASQIFPQDRGVNNAFRLAERLEALLRR
jgi:protoporphyrinogen oxidase